MDPLDGLKKIRGELVRSLELNSESDTMAVPGLSAYQRNERLRQLREVEASIRRLEKSGES